MSIKIVDKPLSSNDLNIIATGSNAFGGSSYYSTGNAISSNSVNLLLIGVSNYSPLQAYIYNVYYDNNASTLRADGENYGLIDTITTEDSTHIAYRWSASGQWYSYLKSGSYSIRRDHELLY